MKLPTLLKLSPYVWNGDKYCLEYNKSKGSRFGSYVGVLHFLLYYAYLMYGFFFSKSYPSNPLEFPNTTERIIHVNALIVVGLPVYAIFSLFFEPGFVKFFNFMIFFDITKGGKISKHKRSFSLYILFNQLAQNYILRRNVAAKYQKFASRPQSSDVPAISSSLGCSANICESHIRFWGFNFSPFPFLPVCHVYGMGWVQISI